MVGLLRSHDMGYLVDMGLGNMRHDRLGIWKVPV